MTDLEINVALAKAVGWVELSSSEFWNTRKSGVYGEMSYAYCYDPLQFPRPKVFDYRDPVVFLAICKHWKLNIYHRYNEASFVNDNGTDFTHANSCIEKAAALCVIELTKRGTI